MAEFEQCDDNSVAPTPSINSPSRKRKRETKFWSDVWKDFDRKEIGKDKYGATCKTCKKILSSNSNGGTSHLKNHAIRCKKKNMTTLGESSTPVFSQVESRKDLASMIILHEYPLSIVDHLGFRKFVAGLRPEFIIMSRNTIKKDIIKIYDVELAKTYKLLESVGRVAITTDMWSAKPTKKGFMAITAHFIDDNWRLQNRLLTFIYVPIPHNKETLSSTFLESIDFWNIEKKISTITMDNATTNDAMLPIILRALPRASLLLGGKFIHMRCSAHILNLIVKEGLTVVGSQIERIRYSCFYWTATQSRIEKFQAAALQLHIPFTKALELDVKTRWNSTYQMLCTALLYKEVFAKAKQRDRSYDSLPSDDDWVVAQQICDRLRIFNDVTVLFSGTSYATANYFFPKICEIKLELAKWLTCSSEVVKAMAVQMVEKCNKYWSECHTIMGIACVLDPRFKLKLVEFYFNQIYGSESEVEVEKIRKACYDLFFEYRSKYDVASSDVPSSSGATNLNEYDALANFDAFVSESSANLESELDLYLREKLVPRRGQFDILKWWDAQKGFPILQKIAKDLLAVQVSTVASESTFSGSGRLVTPHRSRLHPTTLQALMCAQSWLWSELKDSDLKGAPKYLAKVVDEEEEPKDDVDMEGPTESSGAN